jgi:hypothetical protein
MNQFLEAFDRIERSCGERFRANKPDDTGIIGISLLIRQTGWIPL